MSDSTNAQVTVGSGDYVVQQGDCVSSIASKSGHFWQTLWNDPANAELRQARGNPNILLPGDCVSIRPIETKQETKPVDQRHCFRRKGEPAKLKVRLMMPDDNQPSHGERATKPRANQPYRLNIDGVPITGQTDGNGVLEVPIPATAKRARLVVGPDNMEFDLELGAIDPAGVLSGMQGRLNNIGFHCGATDGVMNDETRQAVRLFQLAYGLEATGEVDASTNNKVLEVHGS